VLAQESHPLPPKSAQSGVYAKLKNNIAALKARWFGKK
jgi:hypothetical protein